MRRTWIALVAGIAVATLIVAWIVVASPGILTQYERARGRGGQRRGSRRRARV